MCVLNAGNKLQKVKVRVDAGGNIAIQDGGDFY